MATKHKVKRYNGEEDGSEVEVGAPMRRGEVETTDIPPMEEEKAAPVKPKMITMDTVKAAGFNSLRDYLNDQQKLKPRNAPAKTVTATTGRGGSGRGMQGGPTAAELDTYDNRNKSAVDRIPRDKSTVPAGESASGSDLGRNVKTTMGAMAGTRLPKVIAGVAGETMAGKRAAAAAEKLIADRAARVAARRTAASTRGDRPASMAPFAKGGAVSSASKRADGCAMRGKTRA